MASALQKVRALHLYRNGLKNILSWAVRREVFYVKAEEYRAAFEANAHLTDPMQIERALDRGEEWLVEQEHPDPYTVPYRPGGNLYARNPPFPDEIGLHLNFGREGGH